MSPTPWLRRAGACFSFRAGMPSIRIRLPSERDLPRLTEIYNHYVVHGHAVFDESPVSLESRREWFDSYRPSGAHRF